jgi:hypothetical protein
MTPADFLKSCVAKWSTPTFGIKGIERLNYTTALRPADYLRFANADLKQNLEHFQINALSNAKRAIDCQVDNLFSAFGLIRKRTFPEKLAVVEELGLLAPRILKKVVKVRNLLEHEYYRPQVAEVEDAVDLASLFVEASARPFRGFMTAYFIADGTSAQRTNSDKRVKEITENDYRIDGYTFTESVFVEFDAETHTFQLDLVSKNKAVAEIQINQKSSLYKQLTRYTIEHDFNHDQWDEHGSAVAFIGLLEKYKNDL